MSTSGEPTPDSLMAVLVLGQGKVGRSLAAGLRAAGAAVELRPSRGGWPAATSASAVILACRDGDLAKQAAASRQLSLGAAPVALLHCAGALAPQVLAPARRPGLAIGQWHPLLSFSDAAHPPALGGGYVRLAGEPHALAVGQRLCDLLGMHAVTGELDLALYHAAAALLANGTAALVDAAARTLREAGVEAATAERMLRPLLASVVANVERQGVPEALSGPVRRGAVSTVESHLRALAPRLEEVHTLYRALAQTQLDMAKRLGDASAADLAALARLLKHPPTAEQPAEKLA